MNEHKLNMVWRAMLYRCYNKHSNSYKHYGGRGITVCDEWVDDYSAFETWALNNGYAEGLSIERIDTNGNYSPENCKWATQQEQCNNMRRNIRIEYNGKTLTLAQWAKELSINYYALRERYRRGTFPPTEENAYKRRNKLIEHNGKSLTMKQWAEELGVDYCSIKHKVKRGTFPPTEANANKRRNKLIEYQNKCLTTKQWAEELKIPYGTLKKRVKKGVFPPKD